MLHNINLHNKNVSSYYVFPNLSCVKNNAHTIRLPCTILKENILDICIHDPKSQEKLPSLLFFFCGCQHTNTQHTHTSSLCSMDSSLTNQCSSRALASTTVRYRNSFSWLFTVKNRPAELYQHLIFFFTWSYILSREDNQMQLWEQVHSNSTVSGDHLCLGRRKSFLLKQLFFTRILKIWSQ